jgi:hypothetical protein
MTNWYNGNGSIIWGWEHIYSYTTTIIYPPILYQWQFGQLAFIGCNHCRYIDYLTTISCFDIHWIGCIRTIQSFCNWLTLNDCLATETEIGTKLHIEQSHFKIWIINYVYLMEMSWSNIFHTFCILIIIRVASFECHYRREFDDSSFFKKFVNLLFFLFIFW